MIKRFTLQILGRAALVAALGAFAHTATAQDRNDAPLKSALTLDKVLVNAEGAERFVTASEVSPGDLVEYRVTYTNVGDQPLGNIVVKLPIPPDMTYISGSAQPTGADAATANEQFAPEPLMHTVQQVDGRTVEEPVPASDYRFLRWQIPVLKPGDEFAVRARARVSANTPTSNL